MLILGPGSKFEEKIEGRQSQCTFAARGSTPNPSRNQPDWDNRVPKITKKNRLKNQKNNKGDEVDSI